MHDDKCWEGNSKRTLINSAEQNPDVIDSAIPA